MFRLAVLARSVKRPESLVFTSIRTAKTAAKPKKETKKEAKPKKPTKKETKPKASPKEPKTKATKKAEVKAKVEKVANKKSSEASPKLFKNTKPKAVIEAELKEANEKLANVEKEVIDSQMKIRQLQVKVNVAEKRHGKILQIIAGVNKEIQNRVEELEELMADKDFLNNKGDASLEAKSVERF